MVLLYYMIIWTVEQNGAWLSHHQLVYTIIGAKIIKYLFLLSHAHFQSIEIRISLEPMGSATMFFSSKATEKSTRKGSLEVC